jgi:hypothetical protein
MGDRSHIESDVVLAAELHKGTLDEVGAVVSDDAVREAIAVDELVEELGSILSIALDDWLGLNPLCEFVDHNEQVSVSSWSLLELANHMESPNDE